MTMYDTIYHELVHLYDPKFAKGISKSETQDGLQKMTTPHEVDAQVSGFVDLMREKLDVANDGEKKNLIKDLKNWLRKADDETEGWNMPRLLAGMPIYHLKKSGNWRKFISIIYNTMKEYE